jgi:hypothetical protein
VRLAGPDGYWVSDDRALIDVQRVHAWMSRESYWAAAAGIRQVLMAEPGRSIYGRIGFGVLESPERWMERPGDRRG